MPIGMSVRKSVFAGALMLTCLSITAQAGREIITFNDNGGWCWFQDERAIVHEGKLIIGSIANAQGVDGAERGGNIEVTTFDLAGRKHISRVTLHTHLENDDHDVPALLVLPNGHFLAVYATHGRDRLIRTRISAYPGDATDWLSESTIAREAGVTYSNLFHLASGVGGKSTVYNFYRGEHWSPNWITSEDQGATWRYGGRLIDFKGRPYVKYASNQRDTIHFVTTEHHPHNHHNSLHHGYLKDGKIHRSDGTVICAAEKAPIRPERATTVFAGDANNVAWPCDLHLDHAGRPYVVYSIQQSLVPENIRYRYARWDGRTWRDHFLAHAGTSLYPREAHYTGLVALDPADPDRLYVSTDAHPATGEPLISAKDQKRHYEIFAGRTCDRGATWQWEPITENSDVDNLRPIVPIGCDKQTVLLWLRGTYTSYTEYDLAVVGVIEDPLTPAERADRLLRRVVAPNEPGAAVAVVHKGNVVFEKGYGRAHLEYDVPITPTTIFHVASVSKQFTAFAIALLAEQGKLSLDDDIRTHLPEVPDFGKTITIRNLIHHTSGLRDQWELFVMAGGRLDDVITQDDIMRLIRRQRDLNFEPGAEYLYCNTGYTLLAEIVARVSGQSLRQYTTDTIFTPLGMTQTHFHNDHEHIVPNRAYSYARRDDGVFRKCVLSYANAGATSLFTTAGDLMKWIENFAEPRVGGASVIQQMHERGKLNSGKQLPYAFGLTTGQYRSLRTVGHGGADAGFRSQILWFPDQRFGVVVLSNLGSFSPRTIARQVADIYLEAELGPQAVRTARAAPKAVSVDDELYDEYAGRYQFPGLVLTVVRQKGKLMGQATSTPQVELIPESDTEFIARIGDAEARLTFQRNAAGQVQQVAALYQGLNMTGRRIDEDAADTQALEEFAGEYYSGELDTTYTLTVQGHQIVARHRRHDGIELAPGQPDQFHGADWWLGKLVFQRDKDEQITGFKLTGSRVRNVRFEKIARRKPAETEEISDSAQQSPG